MMDAAELWALFADAPMACQDCFVVELAHDPQWGPMFSAFSCTSDAGPCSTIEELVADVHSVEVPA
jgi:hypothetical protein